MLFPCAVDSSPWSAIAFSGFQPRLEEVLGLVRDGNGNSVLPDPRCSSPQLAHLLFSPSAIPTAIFLSSAMFETSCSRLLTSISPIYSLGFSPNVDLCLLGLHWFPLVYAIFLFSACDSLILNLMVALMFGISCKTGNSRAGRKGASSLSFSLLCLQNFSI